MADVKKILKQNYRAQRISLRFFYEWKNRFQKIVNAHDFNKDSIVIYQMGKVGSSSVKKSLVENDIDKNIYHVHALTNQRIKELKKVYKRASKFENKIIIDSHLLESSFIKKVLFKDKSVKQWKIVTLVRDPVARNISSFFQAFHVFYPELMKEYRDNVSRMEGDIEKLTKYFFEKFDHNMPLRWFDAYFKPVFGVDMYAYRFPCEKGYVRHQDDNVDVLLLRVENLSDCGEEALGDFLGKPNFHVKNSNISSEKKYSKALSNFKENLKIPYSYLEEMYSSKYAQHFYTADEIDKFMDKWSKHAI